ncbi:MAG: hypothetical protein DRJ68_06990 [Thermoprotei archaeon]|nr:MAG: hypothetical protein DRJ68_06990 [Thermoprotei archaeon]
MIEELVEALKEVLVLFIAILAADLASDYVRNRWLERGVVAEWDEDRRFTLKLLAIEIALLALLMLIIVLW